MPIELLVGFPNSFSFFLDLTPLLRGGNLASRTPSQGIGAKPMARFFCAVPETQDRGDPVCYTPTSRKNSGTSSFDSWSPAKDARAASPIFEI